MEGQSSNDDSGRKRKRTSSGSVSLTSSYISNNLNHYGETILNCTVHISKGIKECGNDIVLKYTCALLNSGGGILHMRNLDHEHRVQSKDLDTWWGGMENKLVDIISGDDICNYFDMIGNYDDQDLYLFVKSAEHICTIDYHSRLPTDTATHEVSYQSVIKLLRKQGQCHSLSDLPPIPDIFIYGKTCESLKQETKQIQFKQFSASTNKDSKSLPDRIKYTVCKYISAFANHEGGHIYFGIDDTRAAVYGEELSVADQDRTVKLVQNRMNLMIWGDSQFKAEMGVHWDIKFCPVEQCSKKKGRRVVVIISVCKFPGGVFTACPDSYFISEDGSVQSWTFHQWKLSMLNQFRDKPELHNRFERLPLTVPQAPLVYTLKHTLDKITAKLLNEHTSCKPQPPHFLETVTALEERVIIQKFLEHFHGDRHISIFVNCWGMGIMTPLPDEVICDILILSETQGCHLLTFSHKDLPHVWQHTQSVAANIKFKLVSLGGCIDKFGIICHLINLNDKDDLFASLLLENFYPSHYSISSIRLDNILQAMIIAMSAYTPVDFTTLADSKRETILSSDIYFFLLTCDQFELLWSQQYTKELWVHSPPGGGKTVAAVQFILELRRRGCSKTNVLYIAENEMLCSYVRSYDICMVISRRKFLQILRDTESSDSSPYQDVHNVIVDEAQNFKDRDGDWYGEIQKLLQLNNTLSRRSVLHGYFWVFMDYAQKVHKFNAGLPSIIGRNNFMMSEVTRNSKEIFDYAVQFMHPHERQNHEESTSNQSAANNLTSLSRVESEPILGHDYSTGRDVEVINCDNSEVKKKLFQKLSQLLDSGVGIQDLAILVSKTQEKKDLKTDIIKFEQERADHMTDHVTIETVKGFSGLDKRAVIGVNPHVDEQHADLNKFLVNLATRAMENLIIIKPNE